MKKKRTLGYYAGLALEANPHAALEPREPTDLCMLCKINEATKTGSHLISRFLTRRFFEDAREFGKRAVTNKTKSRIKQAVLKGTASAFSIVPLKRRTVEPVSSTGKEDYLLCPSCEHKIEIVETEFARNFFSRFRNPASKQSFSSEITTDDYQGNNVLFLDSINPNLIALFVYSLFWRVSVSSLISNPADLEVETEETLRVFLNTYLGELDDINARSNIVAPIPFVIMASRDTKVDMDLRSIYQTFTSDESTLYIDSICFIIGANIRAKAKYINWGNAPCKVKICNLETWRDLKETIKEDSAELMKKQDDMMRKSRF